MPDGLSPDNLRSWLSTLWPLVVAVVAVVMSYANLRSGQLDLAADQARLLADHRRFEESATQRMAALDQADRTRDVLINALETEAKVFQERMTNSASVQTAIMARLGDLRGAVQEEHRALLAAVREVSWRPPVERRE